MEGFLGGALEHGVRDDKQYAHRRAVQRRIKVERVTTGRSNGKGQFWLYRRPACRPTTKRAAGILDAWRTPGFYGRLPSPTMRLGKSLVIADANAGH